jgi:prepilin-type N-terminal cleavage/methylation domain-containing protein
MNMPNRLSRSRGFTLIELLVVIAIIGVLSSIALASLNSARSKGNDAKRVSDLREVQKALETYASDNGGNYPVSGSYRSQCNAWGGYTSSTVIPGLVPNYISAVPADPQMNAANNTCCYLYISDGTDYGMMLYSCPTDGHTTNSSLSSLKGPTYQVWSVYTPGAGTKSWI